jgi:hypothetical protein
VEREIAGLEKTPIRELRRRYGELFGDETKTANKAWLVKRIAWRIQSMAEGGLSDRAKRRALEIANESDIRLSPPRVATPVSTPAPHSVVGAMENSSDGRLPVAGAVLVREYKGAEHHVLVLQNGFEYDGQAYRSLSAVAKRITGTHCNGFHFFHLTHRKGGNA